MDYQKELDGIIDRIRQSGLTPSLLVHSCCAPCSSYVLEYLAAYFSITILYYNPNIYPEEEYIRRAKEQKGLIKSLPVRNQVRLIEGNYNPEDYYKFIRGYENEPEAGERCFLCYRMRLMEAAALAKEGGFDYFTTTLSISPYKNAAKLYEIGKELGRKYGVEYLPSDFKKKGGYQRSIELSKQYGLYRQDYCGCIFSMKERENRKNRTIS